MGEFKKLISNGHFMIVLITLFSKIEIKKFLEN